MTYAVKDRPRYLRDRDASGKTYTIGAIRPGATGNIFRKDITSDCIVDSPRGLSIRTAEFNKLAGLRVKIIWMVILDTRQLYVASLEKFTEKCVPIDKGTGPHKLLEMKYWAGPLKWNG